MTPRKRLSSEHRSHLAAEARQRREPPPRAHRHRRQVLRRLDYALIYDFGGSADGFGGTAAGSLPGGGTSGVENAYLSYTGFRPFGGKMAIEGGIMDIPWTMDEATSSNDILFMERASVGIIAQNIAAGDFRSGAGTRWWNDQLWIGGYVTGPTTGAIHSASSVTPAGTSEQYGGVIRVAGRKAS